MAQNEKKRFWDFVINYNVLLLGYIYFVILVLIILKLRDNYIGVIYIWHLLLYLLSLIFAFGSWIYCVKKSWTLTNFSTVYRLAIMAYLFGAPAILFFITGDIALMAVQTQGIWLDTM
mgnify:CR=1 FL=1|jgi:hypothetical protein